MSRRHDEQAGNGNWPALAEAVRVITGSLLSDARIQGGFIQLLVAAGRMHPSASAKVADVTVRVTRERSEAFLEELLELALIQAAGEDDAHLAEIRQFFLDPREAYSLDDLAMLWRVSLDDAADICHDEIEQWEQSSGAGQKMPFQLPWAKAIGTTIRFALLRPFDIERALGDRFLEARSDRWRTVAVVVRLPRFVAEAFELHASTLPKLSLAHRIEQVLLEFFTTDSAIDTWGYGGDAL
jgi:hypothetical protein